MKLLVFILSVLVCVSGSVFGAIPASERAALIALYNSTDGDNWWDNSNWKGVNNEADGFSEIGSEGTWAGITVTSDHVRIIEMWFNDLWGTIPPELGNLSNLEKLIIYDSGLSGPIPAQLGNLNNLKYLHLYSSQLSGAIPPQLENLSNLEELSLSGTQLSGPIPPEFGNLSSLIYLDISSNTLSGTIPPELGNLSNLESLYLSGNKLSGSIPPELGNLSNLEKISLSYNQLSGTIPPELGNLSNLEKISLSYNQLSGAIPPGMGNLSKLLWVEMDNNQLSGAIPPELGNLSNLEGISLSYNQLTGAILQEIGNWSRMIYIDLRSNQLSGPIPQGMGNLSELFWLEMDDNQLSGAIPPELGNLSNLEGLGLSSNQLSGSIPPELGNLSSLTYLGISSNTLSGTIPPELGNLSNLENLYLSSNQLSGTIPKELGNLSQLTHLDLNNNFLTGTIPATLMNLNILWPFPLFNIRDNSNLQCENQMQSDGQDMTAWLNNLDPEWFNYQNHSEPLLTATSFGNFSTPLDGSTVNGSIAITGWALDDAGIRNVKLYYERDGELEFIEDADFVEGARPDIVQKYRDAGYPDTYRAGWGYLFETHSLPNQGNGTYVLHAIVTDSTGETTSLGKKTIYCDNASAVIPFGDFSWPPQGGNVYHFQTLNFGWVLTPQPNTIPKDGTSINIYIDGIYRGHPDYNEYNSEIAFKYPGYNNSNGAEVQWAIMNYELSNGPHTICWIVRDDAGNTAGIGSRYYNIWYEGSRNSRQQEVKQLLAPHQYMKILPEIPVNPGGSVHLVKGFEGKKPVEISSDPKGKIHLKLKELGRIEIRFFSSIGSGSNSNQKVWNYSYLPVGSTLDSEKGIFYWSPGPGFIGEYKLGFLLDYGNGIFVKKEVIITIIPLFKE